MKWVQTFGAVAISLLFVGQGAVAQDDAASAQPPASPGIVFHKPPSSPILGVQKITPDVVDIIKDDSIRSLIIGSDFTFTRRGLANVYRARMKGTSLQLPNDIIRRLRVDASEFWIVDDIEIDTVVFLSEPWSKAAYDAKTIRINDIEVTKVALDWGGISLSGDGRLTVDEDGLVSGKIDLRVASWNPKFSLTDKLPNASTSQLDSLLQVVLVGGELTIPLNFADGVIKIGILPVGNIDPLLP